MAKQLWGYRMKYVLPVSKGLQGVEGEAYRGGVQTPFAVDALAE